MNDFLQTCLTFPTVAYSILLAFCLVYWMLAMTGLFDTDTLDSMIIGDGSLAHGDAGDPTATAGVLARLGLGGVPIMVVLTVLFFLGWLTTYFVHLLVLSHLPDSLRILAGIATVLAALVPGVLLTSLLLRPLSKLITRLQPPGGASILGRVGTVISPAVNAQDGRAEFDDGGAGLILQVRAPANVTFVRGERVVLLSHDALTNTHAVISEIEFNKR